MATLTRGQTFGATETVTNTKLHNLVDLGTVTSIVNDDCDANMGLVDTKLADITTGSKVRGTALSHLSSIPASAGQVPAANISLFGVTTFSLSSIPNQALVPIVLASWVDGAAVRNLASVPQTSDNTFTSQQLTFLASVPINQGRFNYQSLVASLASGSVPIYDGANSLAGKQLRSGSMVSLRLNSILNSNLLHYNFFGLSIASNNGTIMPTSGVFKNLYVRSYAADPTAIGMYINNIATSLIAAVPVGATISNITNLASFSQGDRVTFLASNPTAPVTLEVTMLMETND